MNRADVLTRLKGLEPRLRAHGVSALYLFGSYSRNEADATSDIDVLVDADAHHFYDLSNFMGAYEELRDAFPDVEIGYSTRDGISKYVRRSVERDAIRVF